MIIGLVTPYYGDGLVWFLDVLSDYWNGLAWLFGLSRLIIVTDAIPAYIFDESVFSREITKESTYMSIVH